MVKEAPIKSVLTPVKPGSAIISPKDQVGPEPKEEGVAVKSDDEMAMASQLEQLATEYTHITENVAANKGKEGKSILASGSKRKSSCRCGLLSFLFSLYFTQCAKASQKIGGPECGPKRGPKKAQNGFARFC